MVYVVGSIGKLGFCLCLLVALEHRGWTQTEEEGRWLAEFFGCTHTGAKYSVATTRQAPVDPLNEGADHIEAMGAGVLKLWLNSRPSWNYPNFTGLPALTFPTAGRNTAYPNMASLLAHPFYREAIGRPAFKVVAFVATEFSNVTWRDGLSPAEELAVVSEFKEVTEYLLDTYAQHGKTFILQNWEGDNLLNLDLFPDQSTWPAMADGLFAYFKARQRGIEQGRAAAAANSTSRVWHAIEINYNWGGARAGDIPVPEDWTVLNRIVRDGYRDHGLLADLYSWSNWSSKIPGQEWRLITGIDYMRARVPTSGPFGDRAIFVGEFGAYENSFYKAGEKYHSTDSDATYTSVNFAQFSNAWRTGLRHAVYWQLYANGLQPDASFSSTNPVAKTQEELVGTWLIRPPSASHASPTYTSLHGRFAALMDCWSTEDTLTDFGLVHAEAGGWAASSTAQTWAPGVARRIYRAEASTPASITYRTEGDLVEWNVTAFFYDGTPSNRIRGYTSADGVTWSAPFAFNVVFTSSPDPAVPSWTRVFLGAPSTPPVGTRYLKLEIHATDTTWRTQIGDVKLLSRGVRPSAATLLAPALVRPGDRASLTTAATGRGPLRYRWYRDGIFLRETQAPSLEIAAAAPTDSGLYHVEVGNYAGFAPSSATALMVAASQLDYWTRTHFTTGKLTDPSVSGPVADPDSDGLPNLLEYALSTDPRTATNDAIAFSPGSPSSDEFVISFQRVADPLLVYTIENSIELKEWTPIWASTGPANVAGEVRVTAESSGDRRKFFRVRVALP
jgi:hypothetical protein